MKLRRRTVLLSLVLLILAAGAYSLPAVHWRLHGWLHGEAIYLGRPTSWWREQIERNFYLDHSGDMWEPMQCYVRQNDATAWHDAYGSLFGYSAYYRPQWLTDGDAQGLPVLLELTGAPSDKARYVAAFGLGDLVAQSPEALHALIGLARNDPDDFIRSQAVRQVWRHAPEAAEQHGLPVPLP